MLYKNDILYMSVSEEERKPAGGPESGNLKHVGFSYDAAISPCLKPKCAVCERLHTCIPTFLFFLKKI